MSRIKKLLYRNIKLIIVSLIFLAIGAGVTYSATNYLYDSNIIGYDNSNSGLTSTDVQGALDELYNTYANNTGCPEGYTQYSLSGSDGFKCIITMGISDILSDAVMDNIASTYVTNSTGIKFSAISSDTNGKGLYILSGTENNAYPIYYYRGAVTNNNVLFANFCWKIVRTTDTGGVKLIYNGLPASGKCTNTTGTSTMLSTTTAFNTNYDNKIYIGYTYNNNGTNTNSTIKTVIDNWYASNMKSYTSYLEDTIWCNDRGVSSTSPSGNTIYYGAYGRLINNNQPSLNCSQASDRYTVSSANGNGLLTYPVGLLTADELVYAGGKYNTSNNTYYLYNGASFWLGSPLDFGNGYVRARVAYVASGLLNGYTVRDTFSVRPVVSLKNGIVFTGGDGTSVSPYVVE